MAFSKKPELLCPARDLEVLRTAVDYGADAVYIGGEAFSLRSKAHNFTFEEMAEGAAYAHRFGKRVYAAANIFAHESDLDGAAAYFRALGKTGVDAAIISDPGMFMLCREYCPALEIHISTQASLTNHLSFDWWYRQGAKRVVCARELSMEEISEIRQKTDPGLEIEAFVHGSMCISYSGRCLLSNYFAGRDSNRGECSHPCRWKYAVAEETRPGQYLPIEEDERGTLIFDSGDLCMIGHLDELCGAGVDSLKIEGRMKNALYVATMASAYRRALDELFLDREKYLANVPSYLEAVHKCTYREFNTGFYFGKPGREGMNGSSSDYMSGAVFIGIVESADGNTAEFIQRNRFFRGEEIEVLKKDGTFFPLRVRSVYSQDGTEIPCAPRPKERLRVIFEGTGGASVGEGMPEAGDVLRRIDKNDGKG